MFDPCHQLGAEILSSALTLKQQMLRTLKMESYGGRQRGMDLHDHAAQGRGCRLGRNKQY